MAKLKKILWAVDAFERAESLKGVVSAIQSLVESSQAQVHPVYILNPSQLNLNLEFSATWIKEYRPAAEKALQSLLKSFTFTNLKPGKVIVEHRPSLTASSDALVQFAQKIKADVIVVSTHARKGLERFFLGSFAETLILRSKKIPCYLVNPSIEGVRNRVQKILFATDFSRKSIRALEHLLEFAKSMNAEVTVFHALQAPLEAVLQSGAYLLGGGWVPVRQFMQKEIEAAQEKMKRLVSSFEKKGYPFSYEIEPNVPSIIDSILKKAQQYDCIAMASQSGPIASVVVGSITRQVLRQSSVPVWILHP